jgi:hypothetical protein
MDEQNSLDKLKEWVLVTYLEKQAWYDWLKVWIPILVLFIGSCIAYALVNNSNVSAAQTTIVQHTQKIDELNTQINQKLDKLLEYQNRQDKLDAIRRGEK